MTVTLKVVISIPLRLPLLLNSTMRMEISPGNPAAAMTATHPNLAKTVKLNKWKIAKTTFGIKIMTFPLVRLILKMELVVG